MMPASEVLSLESLVALAPGSITSRVLAKAPGGTITLFAFDAGQGLTEHTSPYDALVHVLEGEFRLTIGGLTHRAPGGSLVRMPANVPHAVEADEPSKMLLTLIK